MSGHKVLNINFGPITEPRYLKLFELPPCRYGAEKRLFENIDHFFSVKSNEEKLKMHINTCTLVQKRRF